MTELAPPKRNFAMKPCANPECGKPVHWKHPNCKACGAPNPGHKVPKSRRHQKTNQQAVNGGQQAENQVPQPVVIAHPADPPPTYVMLDKFSAQLGDVMGHFKKGALVTDPNLVAKLQRLHAPMVPASTADGFVVCPHCRTMFALDRNDKAPSRRAG